MYRFTVSAVNIGSDIESHNAVGHFTFFGDSGTTLIGRDALLLIATTKGRSNFVPPAITGIAGKKCTIIAGISEKTFDVDPRILFLTVSKCELIKDSASEKKSSSYTKTTCIK
jgi:hypothetical protein